MKRSFLLFVPLLMAAASCGINVNLSDQTFHDGVYYRGASAGTVVQLYSKEDFAEMAAKNIAMKELAGNLDTVKVINASDVSLTINIDPFIWVDFLFWSGRPLWYYNSIDPFWYDWYWDRFYIGGWPYRSWHFSYWYDWYPFYPGFGPYGPWYPGPWYPGYHPGPWYPRHINTRPSSYGNFGRSGNTIRDRELRPGSTAPNTRTYSRESYNRGTGGAVTRSGASSLQSGQRSQGSTGVIENSNGNSRNSRSYGNTSVSSDNNRRTTPSSSPSSSSSSRTRSSSSSSSSYSNSRSYGGSSSGVSRGGGSYGGGSYGGGGGGASRGGGGGSGRR